MPTTARPAKALLAAAAPLKTTGPTFVVVGPIGIFVGDPLLVIVVPLWFGVGGLPLGDDAGAVVKVISV